jgi:hypothetical protein
MKEIHADMNSPRGSVRASAGMVSPSHGVPNDIKLDRERLDAAPVGP